MVPEIEPAVLTRKSSKLGHYCSRVLASELVRFLIVGGLSFAIDFGLLVLLHEVLLVELWIATPIAFLTSLVFNFLLQRIFTFKAQNGRSVSFLKYCILVVFNTFAVDFIVNFAEWIGVGYQIGKIFATIVITGWNYVLYKQWIFRAVRN